MTEKLALKVLTEMNKWRRGEPPYDDVSPERYEAMPYEPSQFGEAIDVAIEVLNKKVNPKVKKCRN